MKISHAVAEFADIAIKFGEQTLNVKYRPAAYTPAFEDAIHEAGQEDGKDALTEMAAGLLHSWDLTDENELPIGTDATTLRGLPLVFLTGVLKPIMEKFNPNPKKAGS